MADWDHKKVLKLVELYETKPELWDPTNNNYHMRNKKYDAWSKIASDLDCDINEIKGKMTSLLSSFRREKMKKKKSLKTGSGANEVYVSKWFAFPAFEFLMEKDKIKETTDTENDTTVPELLSDSEAELEVDESGSLAAESVSESEVQDVPSSPNPSTSHHSPSVPTHKRKIFLSQKKKTIKKKKRTEKDSRVEYAYNLLEKISDTPKNECATFGQHIAAKLEKFKDPVRSTVIHKINNIIFEAEIGKYNDYINNIRENGPLMASSSNPHYGYNSNFNNPHKSYLSQRHTLSTHSNYRYPQGSYNLQTEILSPNSNYSCESYSSQSNLPSPCSNSDHSNSRIYSQPQEVTQLKTTEKQTPEIDLTPLQVLVKSFDPMGANDFNNTLQ